MNNQNNFGNPSPYVSGFQQYHQQPQQQQLNYPPYYADQPQMVHSLAYPPPSAFGYQQAPPPPPDDTQSHVQPEPMNFNSGNNKNNRGNNFHNANQRGQNRQNWSRGNHRGGNRSGQFSSGFQQSNSHFPNARETHQNQGGQGQNKNENRNQNFNQPIRQQQRQFNAAPKNNQNIPMGFQKAPPAVAPATPQSDAPPASVPLTQEEIDFDEQFKKWEDEFDKWKKANVNHPDKDAYRRYEQQFESVRVQLLQRRNEMQKKKKDQQQLTNSVKTAEQEKFESQWNSGDPQNEKKAETPTPSTSKSSLPEPVNPESFKDDCYDEIKHFESLEAVGESFNSVRIWPSRNDGIPCLDLAPEPPKPKPAYEIPIIDLDADDVVIDLSNPPPLPMCKSYNREVVKIEDILDEPGRSKRPEKILIFIRGAPGSGKTYLANLIVEKELARGRQPKYFSIDNIDSTTDRATLEKYQEWLFFKLRDICRSNFSKFIVLEVESGKLQHFNRYAECAQRIGKFTTYVIELVQTVETCVKYNVNRRSRHDIEEAIADLDKNPSPAKHILLDPTGLLMSNRQAVLPSTSSETIAEATTNDIVTNLAQLLQNKNVMDLLQTQLNMQNQPPQTAPTDQTAPLPYASMQNKMNQQNPNHSRNQQNYPNFPPMSSMASSVPAMNMNRNPQFPQTLLSAEPRVPPNMDKENFGFYDNCPTFTPAKIIDYKHVHMPTLAEQLLEFKVFRVIDYKHRSTPQLRMFIKDIDTEKIIQKRKAVALRKKTLEYLKNALRPEDTVSNPKYPRNWEEVKVERPPTTNKRKKKLTAKIRRVLAQKENEWMTVGFLRDKKMDLEEISSEDDCGAEDFEMIENSKPKIQKLEATPLKDHVENAPNTLPDFNSTEHPNVVDIKTLLWRPDRLTRPSWILIILRGAPGSGKSHLTQLIKRKELEMVSSGPRIISINDYFEDDDAKESECDPQMMETYLTQMVRFVEKTIKERRYEMIIVDAENVDLKFYNQFHQAGTSKGFTTYTIEMNQTLEFCLGQNIHNKSSLEISEAIEKLQKNPTPRAHTLLIPTALYKEYDCLVNPTLMKEMNPVEGQMSPPVESKPLSQSTLIDQWEYFEEAIEKLSLSTNKQSVIDIKTILDAPWRNNRSEKILIILRGASGSGKSYLAGLIRDREAQFNLAGVLLLSIADYFVDSSTKTFKYDASKLSENIQKMFMTLTNVIREGNHNFILIDANNENPSDYRKFIDAGTSNGFKCYLIDFFSAASITEKIDYENHSPAQNKANLQTILSSLPKDVVLLNPVALYKNESVPTEVFPLKSALRTSENVIATTSLKAQDVNEKQTLIKKDPPKIPEFNWHNREIVDAHDIFEEPGRSSRPEKIVVVLRGAPGSGKSFLADLIQQKETKRGNRAQFKIVSLDAFVGDDFHEKKINEYMESLIESLNEIMQSSKYNFIVVDADCCDLLFYNRIYEVAEHHNFTGFTIELNQDDSRCIQQCEHKRDEEIIAKNRLMAENPTPKEHSLLDPEYLYEENCFEGGDELMEFEAAESDEEEAASTFGPLRRTTIESKWDDDGDAPEVLIERLDGTRNKTFEHLTMAAYLQTEDEWTMRPSTSGKKRVRWADIEEKKEQERMREIGFIVGQTDWKRMTDTTDGKSALEKTKYIEPRKK